MAMTIRLPEQLDSRLTHLTQQTGRAKSFYLIKALESYLEDMEDLLLSNAVLERVQSGVEKTYTSQEVRDAIKLAREVC
ncbi:type II toxin-antitoxin system RelB family antitoxin [Rodentibacter myodis]|uniref:CopG family transcriptional regulator n=1 Tax=Rodentibacter myodis TaxID=1907939 RepID=A0A1V3JSN4_9PAST|nr:CopG family transcriptional regulator [Rodentibacter myodis]OOF59712.1 CopG family transcriptional regulator [Rodentibacter myodis]